MIRSLGACSTEAAGATGKIRFLSQCSTVLAELRYGYGTILCNAVLLCTATRRMYVLLRNQIEMPCFCKPTVPIF